LTEDWRLKTAAVNAERGRAVKRLKDLEAKARAPLKAWEAAKQQRLASIRTRIVELDRRVWAKDIADLQADRERIQAIEIDATFGEFQGEAALTKDRSLPSRAKDTAAPGAVSDIEAIRLAEIAKFQAETAAKAQ